MMLGSSHVHDGLGQMTEKAVHFLALVSNSLQHLAPPKSPA